MGKSVCSCVEGRGVNLQTQFSCSFALCEGCNKQNVLKHEALYLVLLNLCSHLN